jgi:hypothetical protein
MSEEKESSGSQGPKASRCQSDKGNHVSFMVSQHYPSEIEEQITENVCRFHQPE